MPKMASLMNQVALVRSLDTKIADHGQATSLIETGKRREPGIQHPDLGAVVSRELGERDSAVPNYVSLYLATEGHRRPDPGFLGGQYAAMHLNKSLKPENIDRPHGLSETAHSEREDLRRYLSEQFDRERNAPAIKGYNNTYARVRGLMKSDTLFDLERESLAVRDRYGPTDFGQHTLIARRLIEAGVPMVKVARAWWDSHADNFESHRELVSELDHVMSTLLTDLKERGLLDSTLVITLSEFGRTPDINKHVGRDHFASAWSCSFAGCGIRGGAVHGATSDDGKSVADGKVGAGDVIATIYQTAGINCKKHYNVGQRPVPIVPEDSKPIATVLV
jgi:arylsulfatase A-like enzyme